MPSCQWILHKGLSSSRLCSKLQLLAIDNSIRNITEHPRTWIEALNAVFQIRSECLEDKRLVEKYPASQQVSASTPPHSMQLPRRHCTARPDWHGSLTGHGAAFVITKQFKTGLHPNCSIYHHNHNDNRGPRTEDQDQESAIKNHVLDKWTSMWGLWELEKNRHKVWWIPPSEHSACRQRSLW